MMISEGLALKFQREIGHPDFPGERFVQEPLSKMAERAKSFLQKIIALNGQINSETEFTNHDALGLSILEAGSSFSGISAASAHSVAAEEVLTPWLQKKFHIACNL